MFLSWAAVCPPRDFECPPPPRAIWLDPESSCFVNSLFHQAPSPHFSDRSPQVITPPSLLLPNSLVTVDLPSYRQVLGFPFSALHSSSGLDPLFTRFPHESLSSCLYSAGSCNLFRGIIGKLNKFTLIYSASLLVILSRNVGHHFFFFN